MTKTATIPLLDTESPAYTRLLVKLGGESYLVVGTDPVRGLVLLERLPAQPEGKMRSWDRGGGEGEL